MALLLTSRNYLQVSLHNVQSRSKDLNLLTLLAERTEVTFAVVLEMKEDAAPPESKAARRGVSHAAFLCSSILHDG